MRRSSSRGLAPIKLFMECGRVITGPYGYLVTTVSGTSRRATRTTWVPTPAWPT